MIDTLLVVIPLMLSPGPANVVSFALGMRHELHRLCLFQAGIVVVYAIVSFSLGALTVQVAGAAPGVTSLLRLLGGLFIVYLGIQLIRRTKRDGHEKTPTFANGMMLQLLNPKFPGVVVAVFATRHGQPTWVTAGIIVAVGTLGLVSYATIGSLLSRRVVSESGFRILDVVAGGLLCGVGLWFAVSPLFES